MSESNNINSLGIENPVLLFGDISPDVLRISMLYDPDIDRYQLTSDTTFIAGKTYYERTCNGRTVAFTVVSDRTGNPQSKGYCQAVDNFAEQAGAYVPAVDSLVLVDKVITTVGSRYCKWTTVGTLLRVVSVDEYLGAVLAPVGIVTNFEEDTRSIDYGNGRFMLFFDRINNPGNIVRLIPDKKLMLYGKRRYYYRLFRNTTNQVISSELPPPTETTNGFIPYVNAASKRMFVTASNILECSGKILEWWSGSTYRRYIVPAFNTIPTNTSSYIEISGGVYESGTTYYRLTTAGTYVAIDVKPANYQFTANDALPHVRIGEVIGQGVYQLIPHLNTSTDIDKFGDLFYNKTFYVTDTSVSTMNHVFLPAPCYLNTSGTISDGELITFQVFEYDPETTRTKECLSVELTAKEAATLNDADMSSKRIIDFDVEFNGQSAPDQVWIIEKDSDISKLEMLPRITFDDGSEQSVPVDSMSCFLYGMELVKTTNVGKEYQLLFKFYPSNRLPVDWERVSSVPTKGFLTCRKLLKIVNTAGDTIRKISIIPVWRNSIGRYEFRFLVYKTDWLSPPIIKSLGTSETVEVQYRQTNDTQYVNGKTYYIYYQGLNKYFVDSGAVVGQPIPVPRYEIVTNTTTGDATHTVNIKKATYTDHTAVDVAAIGSPSAFTDNRVALIVMAYNAVHDGLIDELYTQEVALKLTALLRNSATPGWLIGEVDDGMMSSMPYGSTSSSTSNGAIRPYILYKHRTADDADVYWIDASVFTTKNLFLQNFYTMALPPVGVAADNETGIQEAEAMEPTHFKIRTIARANETIEDTVTDRHASGKESDYIAITTTSNELNFASEFVLKNQLSAESVTNPGGSIPTQNVHGVVIVEFANYSGTEYRHLYGVPVEVRLDTSTNAQ